jgi:ABC-type uncharacterized transport system substrate-binding protein
MRRNVPFIAFIGAVAVFLTFSVGLAADPEEYATAPKRKPNGEKWRIGYLEGGPFVNYQLYLKEIVGALGELGWVQGALIPPQRDQEDTSRMWAWIAANIKSDYLEFVADAHYSAKWDKALREKIKAKLLRRLSQKKDIDFMLAMGTWAGQDLANNQHAVPTTVISCSDACAANIVKSVADSGYDHLHARLDPRRYQTQVAIFHDIIGFKRLGVAYENTVAGKSYAAIDDVEKVAKEREFELVRCYAVSDVADPKVAADALLRCHEQLAPKIDAMYLTTHSALKPRNLPSLLAPLNKNKIPTFSQAGSRDVRYGVLLSLATASASFKYAARFHAEVMAKIFNGAKPRALDQVYESPPKIAINLVTAQTIEWDPPVDILGAADEIYQEIETAK